MEIKNFSDLSDFIYNEYSKIFENFGVMQASEKMVNFAEKSLIKYTKLYDKPLYKKAKRELVIQEAIDTMPHSFFWKIFHYDLWQKIKSIYKSSKDDASIQSQTLFPDVVKQFSVPSRVDDD